MTQRSLHAWRVPGIVLTVMLIGLWSSSQAPAQTGQALPSCPADADIWVIQDGHYPWHAWVWFTDHAEPYDQFEARAAEMNGYPTADAFRALPAGALQCIPNVAGYAYQSESALTAAQTARADSLQAVNTALEREIEYLSGVVVESQEESAARTSNFPWWVIPTLLLIGVSVYAYQKRRNDEKTIERKTTENEKLRARINGRDQKNDRLEAEAEESERLIAVMTEGGQFSPEEVSAMVEVAKYYRYHVDLPEDAPHPRGFLYTLEYPFSNSDEPRVIVPGASQLMHGKNSRKNILKSDKMRSHYGMPRLEKIATV